MISPSEREVLEDIANAQQRFLLDFMDRMGEPLPPLYRPQPYTNWSQS